MLNFYHMPAEWIASTAESNTVCFLNTYQMRNDSPKMQECMERNAQVLTECAVSNRPVAIETIVRTICDSDMVVDRSLSTVLNLILYAGIFHNAHRYNYATNTATVHLTARDGYYYELTGKNNNGAYTWTYERKKAGY